MKRRLSKSDIKELNQRLVQFSVELSKKDAVDLVEEEETKMYLMNGTPWFFELEGNLVPHLKLLQEQPTLLPQITVDMGAIKFVTNGADVMRPGITKIAEGIEKGTFVTIIDETHGKPLAVGKALLSSEEMEVAASGKVITSLHYIGDKWWK